MQLTNAPTARQFLAVEQALQTERLARYLPAAGMDKAAAMDLYLWNCAICEAFFVPLHFCEIVCRNAIHRALLFHLGQNWYDNATFRKVLNPRFLSDLDNALYDERKQHGTQMTAHHVASALMFGFWEHLATKRFNRMLWPKGIVHNFPGAHYSKGTTDLHDLIESARRWRNRIAHHRAIFDKDPMRKHHDILELIKWVCPDTAAWVAASSKVPVAIGLRPSV